MRIDNAKKLIHTLLDMSGKGVYVATEFVSGPGMGKSSINEQAACEASLRYKTPVAYIPFILSTIEPPDMRGFGVPVTEDGVQLMRYTQAPWAPGSGMGFVAEGGQLRRAERGEVPPMGIVFLDELRQASHDTQKPAAEFLLNRRVGDTQLPERYIVTAASNRESDRSGVVRELAFLTNRRMVINIEPSLDAWVNWAERMDVNPMAIAFARVKPGVVFADKVPEKPGPFATPRSLVMASQLLGVLDLETFTEAASGLLGEGAAAEFVAFLRVAEELPSFEEIVANPDTVKVPTRPDASYAAMQMLTHRVSDKTARAVFSYLKRMGREFQVAGLRGTFNRCPQMVRTPDFVQWAKENKDLVMAVTMAKGKA